MSLKKNTTLTGLVKFLNTSMKKKSGKKFTIGDAQGYIKRGHLPLYLGGNEIRESKAVEGLKLYNLK